MNVLLSSAGRRVSLMYSFKRALRSLGGGKVYAADADPTAPTLALADGYFVVPRVCDENYVPTLLDFCKKNDIKVVVPLIDPELPILARERSLFHEHGINVMVSRYESVAKAHDKLETAIFFQAIGIPTPRTMKVETDALPKIVNELGFPLVLKPRTGSSGQGVAICYRVEDLYYHAQKHSDLVAQQYIRGTEVTIDVFGDGTGKVLSLVPRKRLKVRGGEVERAVTVDDRLFRDHILHLASHFMPYGAINVQCIVTDTGPYYTEINARFGGGYPLADEAGAAFPELLLQLANGMQPSSRLGQYRRGLLMSRYDTAVYEDVVNLPTGEDLTSLPCNPPEGGKG